MKEILFVILNQYADFEAAPLAAVINKTEGFCVKTVASTKNAVVSVGGFTVTPDYDLSEAMLKDFAGLVLVGGYSWRKAEAKRVAELVAVAKNKNLPIAAICDATVYLGTLGMLNNVQHTSNQLDDLQAYAGEKYTGEKLYQNKLVVSSGNLVTSSGSASLEFAKEVLTTFKIVSNKDAEAWYRFHKLGYYEAMKI